MRRILLVSLLAASFLPAAASAAAPLARISFGVYGDVARFDRLTGQHTSSGVAYIGWDQGRTWGKPYSYFFHTLGEEPELALKTDRPGGGFISPRSIALGQGDAHLIGLAEAISTSGKPARVRPLGEMNNTANPYCGCRGGSANAPRWYRKAFQRMYLILHGGSAAELSAKLRALGMPGVAMDVPMNAYPMLVVIWNPLAVGEPDIRGNHYQDYFPGLHFFDEYGNDYYDFNGVFSFFRTTGLYKAYPGKRFTMPEVGLALDDPAFIRALAAYLRSHRRIRSVSFYNGRNGGRLDLGRKPRSLAAYRRYIAPLSR